MTCKPVVSSKLNFALQLLWLSNLRYCCCFSCPYPSMLCQVKAKERLTCDFMSACFPIALVSLRCALLTLWVGRWMLVYSQCLVCFLNLQSILIILEGWGIHLSVILKGAESSVSPEQERQLANWCFLQESRCSQCFVLYTLNSRCLWQLFCILWFLCTKLSISICCCFSW